MIFLVKHGHGLFATDEESETALNKLPEGVVVAVESKMKTLDISTSAVPNAIVKIDAEDWDYVRRFTWTPKRNKSGIIYAVCYENKSNASMHRCIARARMGEDVDHIDGDGLNNTKSNLRICTNQQNQWNRRRGRGTSEYKGVFKHPNGRFSATLKIEGRRLYLGRFNDEIEAAKAYDAAAIKHLGEFARLNFES